MKKITFTGLMMMIAVMVVAQKYNGIDANMGNIFRMSDAKTRSISPENFKGEKGKGGMATTGNGERAARDLGKNMESKSFSYY
jgi:hypothetical protein